jgi:biotin carboxylase
VETNLALLANVLGRTEFQAGAVTTDWLERAAA